ncbi:MAG: hypothetical protein EON93_08855 [Burkholderiales bacterium]|nr:MAG: hypothetical protein EON93_08855 [Burkholderiales bacterium]
MHSIRQIVSTALLAAGLLGAGGCETLPAAQVAQLSSGEKSAILMTYKQWEGWYAAILTIINVETGAPYKFTMFGEPKIAGDGPALVPVEPGTYRIVRGVISVSDSSATLPLIEYWFRDFKVGQGEIVDLGTLSIQPIHVRSEPGALGALANTLLSFDSRDSTYYMTYEIDSSGDALVQDLLSKKYPSLVGKPVKRPLQITLSQKQFEEIVADAYKPDPSGRLPATEDAREKIGESLRAFLKESLSGQ